MYLEGEMKIGRVAAIDPLIGARLLVGFAANYVFWELVRADQGMTGDVEFDLRQGIDVLWQGLDPEANPSHDKSPKGEAAP